MQANDTIVIKVTETQIGCLHWRVKLDRIDLINIVDFIFWLIFKIIFNKNKKQGTGKVKAKRNNQIKQKKQPFVVITIELDYIRKWWWLCLSAEKDNGIELHSLELILINKNEKESKKNQSEEEEEEKDQRVL